MVERTTEYLTPQEVEEEFRGSITVRTLQRWRSDDRKYGPPYLKVGNRILYPRDGLKKWAKENEYASTSDYGSKKAA